MTQALCLNCGDIKFGALCECRHCHKASTGDWMLDIQFSDHHYAVTTLRGFGDIIKEIHKVASNPTLCFFAFLHYVETRHPEILSANINPERLGELDEILGKCNFPAVLVEPSAEFLMKQARQHKGGNSATEIDGEKRKRLEAVTEAFRQQQRSKSKPWWKFW